MLKSGMSKNDWADVSSLTGYPIVPVGHDMLFEIEEVRGGVSKNGKDEYFQFKCVYTDDEGQRFTDWEYYSRSSERLGFLKGFIEKIGRCDVLVTDEWEDLVGTQFTTDVKHTQKNGETYINMQLSTIQAVSHDFFEIPVDEEEYVDDNVDLDEKIEQEAAKNESNAKQTRVALRNARSTDVGGAKPTSKASPRRAGRAGTNR